MSGADLGVLDEPVTYVGDKATNVITPQGEIKSVNTPEVRAGMRGHRMMNVPIADPELIAILDAKRAAGVGLPANAKDRKTYPIGTGFLDYFPLAAAEVAHVSYVGNEQHNPGEPLHWDRSKSTDEADALIRHFTQRGTTDSDGLRHSAKLAWRALALLEKELEADKK